MPVINLTSSFGNHRTAVERLPLRSEKTAYTGMIYYFDYESMSTSYLDLPGHIAETDDGRHAAMLDPHTAAELNIDDIVAMCDDLIKAHGRMLPKYK